MSTSTVTTVTSLVSGLHKKDALAALAARGLNGLQLQGTSAEGLWFTLFLVPGVKARLSVDVPVAAQQMVDDYMREVATGADLQFEACSACAEKGFGRRRAHIVDDATVAPTSYVLDTTSTTLPICTLEDDFHSLSPEEKLPYAASVVYWLWRRFGDSVLLGEDVML